MRIFGATIRRNWLNHRLMQLTPTESTQIRTTENSATSPIYSFLKWYSRQVLPFYFSRWQVEGREKVPSGALIFASNHRNAFLDAVLIACSTPQNPWFVTRADVFRKPIVRKMLSLLRMLPVYRFRDGFTSMKQNRQVIESCAEKLNSGDSILIFPEGNHGPWHRLRPLQKGIARIALYDDLNHSAIIVPTGIFYESLSGFRSRVLVKFGDPLLVNEVMKSKPPGVEPMEHLLRSLRTAMEPLALHISEDRYEEKLRYLKHHRIFSEDMNIQMANDDKVIKSENLILERKVDSKESGYNKFVNYFLKLNLYPSSFIIHRLILSNIADPQFKGSVKFAVGMFLVPLMWILQMLIIYLLSGSWLLAAFYLLSLIFSLKGYQRTVLE
jgi:1-acyl-sn-glycerol-3-phosphate acyltransferase